MTPQVPMRAIILERDIARAKENLDGLLVEFADLLFEEGNSELEVARQFTRSGYSLATAMAAMRTAKLIRAAATAIKI